MKRFDFQPIRRLHLTLENGPRYSHGDLNLQPELFGLDDGLAGGLDRAAAAGNEVASLAAAYAWRTLKAAFAAN